MTYDKRLWNKIAYYQKIYKFEWYHSLIRCIFFYLIKKNTIKNQKLIFSIICEIRKKRIDLKLFASTGFTNLV